VYAINIKKNPSLAELCKAKKGIAKRQVKPALERAC